VSGPAQTLDADGAKNRFFAKPNPYSIERRFRLMQAGSMGIFLLLMAAVLLGAFSSYRKMEGSLRRLQNTLSLNREIRIAHIGPALAFWQLYDYQPGSTMAIYQQGIREETEALQRYEDFPLNEEEQAEIDHLRSVEKRFRTQTEEDLGDWIPGGSSPLDRKKEVALQSSEIKASLARLSSMQIRDLDVIKARLEKFSRWSALALILLAILGFVVVAWFRDAHQRNLWQPLDQLRSLAGEMHLVSNLTSFARRAPSRMQRIDLRKVLTHLADLRHYQLLANNIYLHLQPPPEPVWVLVDPDQLTQVLLNLVLNSEQAIPDGRRRGDIWVSCSKEKGLAWLSVKDDGAGIDPSIRDRIFDPFFTTKPTDQGTGLGLSIPHGIVQQHRGSIQVDSELGEGPTFLFRPPLAPEQTENQAVPEAAEPKKPQVFLFDPSVELETPGTSAEISPAPGPAAPPVKSETSPQYEVLVIDDEQGILEMISDALERLHCHSTLVPGSADAPAAIEHGNFNLILCDLKMPGQNGLDILRFTREKRPDLASRFLLMTGNRADTEKHAVELAGVPVLPKPFTLSRLRETVEILLPKKTPA
jgi:signal transduction histidine kinase